jgi:Domain of unknown function (DUF4157)
MAANLVNGSTAAGFLAAAAGRSWPQSGPDGLLIAAGYRLPVPAPAFTVGNVVITRMGSVAELAAADGGRLLAHEARHATQYAYCGGLPMLPAYALASAWSWALTGDSGTRNVFERRAGLADGGYQERPLRPMLAQRATRRQARRQSQYPPQPPPWWRGPGGQGRRPVRLAGVRRAA